MAFCSLVHCTPHPSPSGCLHTANPSSLELTSGPWVSVPSPCLTLSGCGVCGGGSDDLCGSHSALPSSVQLLRFLSNFEFPTSQPISPLVKWLPRVWIPFLFNSSLSGMLVLSWFLYSLSLAFFFLLFYPVMWRVSCSFWRFKLFCQHSVDVPCKSFYM